MRFSESHCSRWGGIPQDKLTDHNRLHIEVLVVAFRTGVYNLPINWSRVRWNCGISGTEFVFGGCSLATFDFDHLTRLVIKAHDEAVRVEVQPHTFRHLAIRMWSRSTREGAMSERHPTIDEAISNFRKTT